MSRARLGSKHSVVDHQEGLQRNPQDILDDRHWLANNLARLVDRHFRCASAKPMLNKQASHAAPALRALGSPCGWPHARQTFLPSGLRQVAQVMVRSSKGILSLENNRHSKRTDTKKAHRPWLAGALYNLGCEGSRTLVSQHLPEKLYACICHLDLGSQASDSLASCEPSPLDLNRIHRLQRATQLKIMVRSPLHPQSTGISSFPSWI